MPQLKEGMVVNSLVPCGGSLAIDSVGQGNKFASVCQHSVTRSLLSVNTLQCCDACALLHGQHGLRTFVRSRGLILTACGSQPRRFSALQQYKISTLQPKVLEHNKPRSH